MSPLDASFTSTLTAGSTPNQNVEFMNNPARFSDVYRFRVTFECIAPLEDGTWTQAFIYARPHAE